jgi:hypothetical protein
VGGGGGGGGGFGFPRFESFFGFYSKLSGQAFFFF